MEAYLAEWLNLLLRWAHFITGIAWIGSSFYFIWLDNHLQAPKVAADDAKGVGGEVWSVHGGGFYHAQKYRVAPPALPATLHWFKWEAYSTWWTGMMLLALVYWYGAEVYLIDPSNAGLSPLAAVLIALGFLVGGWLLYDGLCRSPLARHDAFFSVLLLILTSLLAFGLCQLYSGRGAYIHFGAVLGTIMVGNVFFVIIPGQRQMVAAAALGEMPDPLPGIRAKQRSVHNTYFTLPVLFVMTSNHFAFTYGHEYNWLILVGISLAGALVRVYFVARHGDGKKASPLPLVIAVAVLLAIMAVLAPRAPVDAVRVASIDEIRPVIRERCATCHSAQPSHVAFPAAPAGVMLDTVGEITAAADRIYQQTVVLETMPIGNLTDMRTEERALIAAWYHGLRATR